MRTLFPGTFIMKAGGLKRFLRPSTTQVQFYLQVLDMENPKAILAM